MGKKKTVNKNNPEALKEAGNKAFMAGNYEEAVRQFTMAIEITIETPNHIYFANRANCYLELANYEECIQDCNQAIKLDPTFSKSYYRKAKALVNQQKLTQALETLKEGVLVDPENEIIRQFMRDLAEEIEQDNVIPQDHPERKRFQNLLDWMKKGGSDFKKLKLRYYSENYRGVHASQDIRNGETILYVPLKQIITLEMAFKSPLGKLMYEKGLRQRLISPKHSFLGAYLLQEKKKLPNTDFKEYLDILPKGMGDFPIFFTEEERSWLKGSPFLLQIYEKIEDIKVDYNLICKEVPDFAQFTLREYSEVRMMVSSRIFGITVNGVKTDGFVPYADMLNHKRPRQTTWYYSDERQGFIIEACDDIPRGAQVYDSYGRKCNSRFFLNYGFINLNNDANEVPVVIDMLDNDPNLEFKLKLINEQRSKASMKFRLVENLYEQVMNEFLSWLRFVYFEGDMAPLFLAKNLAIVEAQKKRQQAIEDSDDDEDLNDVFKGTTLKFISFELELKVWQRVHEICKQALAQYETNLQFDLDLLAADDQEKQLTQNQRSCVLYRAGEKQILNFLVDASEKMPVLYEMTLKDARKEVNKNNGKDFEGMSEYIKNFVFPAL